MTQTTNKFYPLLTEFLSKKNRDMAILLDGEWGCGKTFFLQNLREKDIQNKKLVYLSLKSIEKLEDIQNDIASQIFFASSSFKKIIKKSSAGKLLDAIPHQFMGANFDMAKIKGFLSDQICLGKDFSDYLFIFDDLERLTEDIKYSEALFYIHSLLLEQKHANVIFVADTKNLFRLKSRNDEKRGYEDAYNKVIERTVSFEQKISDIYENLIFARYKNAQKQTLSYLLKDKTMARIINESPTKNLRRFNSFFDFIVKFYPLLLENADFKKAGAEIKEKLLKELIVNARYLYLVKNTDKNTDYSQENKTKTEALDHAILITMERKSNFSDFDVAEVDYSFIKQYVDKGYLEQSLMDSQISQRINYHREKNLLKEEFSNIYKISQSTHKQIKTAFNKIMENLNKINNAELLLSFYEQAELLAKTNFITQKDIAAARKKVFIKVEEALRKAKTYGDSFFSTLKIKYESPEIADFITRMQQDSQKWLEEEMRASLDSKNLSDDILISYYSRHISELIKWANKNIAYIMDIKNMEFCAAFFIKTIEYPSPEEEEELEKLLNTMLSKMTDTRQLRPLWHISAAVYRDKQQKEDFFFERLTRKNARIIRKNKKAK